MIEIIWQSSSRMYSFFSRRIVPPSVVKMTIAHSTKKIAVKGIDTIFQKPDLMALTSLNWSLRMKTSVTVMLRRMSTTWTHPSKKPASRRLSYTGQWFS